MLLTQKIFTFLGFIRTNFTWGKTALKFNCAYSELVDIHKLQENPKNPNKHPDRQIEMLAKIIDYQGQRSPVVVSKRSGFIVKGHGRLEALRRLQWPQVAVDFQDYESEAQEYADMVADNKIAELAQHDDSMMLDGIKEFGFEDFELLGLDDFELPLEPDEARDAIEDEVPADVETRCKPGDLWILGEHRLLCGDSTNIQHVERLMDGATPDIIYTDPPYGMNAVSKSGVLSKNYTQDIMGDDNTDVAKEAFNTIYGLWPKSKHVWWGANYYSSVLPDSECWMVWDKNNGQSDQTDCELAWANFRSVVRMFTQASEKANRVHPTQKPVSLVEWVFRRFKYNAKTMFDAFGGSGSTLIACEKTNRKCFMMELDPHYCDVILTRWEKYSGKTAILDSQNAI